jgi:hypothetical protein
MTIKNGQLYKDDGLKYLLPFDKEVIINIPNRNNNCGNWNTSFNYADHVYILIDGNSISLANVKNFLNSMEVNKNFLTNGLDIIFDEEYERVIKFYTLLEKIAHELVSPFIDVHTKCSDSLEVKI